MKLRIPLIIIEMRWILKIAINRAIPESCFNAVEV